MNFREIPLVVLIMVVKFSHQLLRDSDGETVHITSNRQISYFTAPLTKTPLSSWIEVQKGIYPKILPIKGKIKVGEPITLLIYFNDPNKKYDITVSDCWAYDNEDYKKTKNRLNLVNDEKGTKEWIKLNYSQASNITSVLYSNFTSFKFPDTDRVYLTCNIKLCLYVCRKQEVT
ncbi:hypothetical protein Trydic_g4035 [Trypoxylus dichotomus]